MDKNTIRTLNAEWQIEVRQRQHLVIIMESQSTQFPRDKHDKYKYGRK